MKGNTASRLSNKRVLVFDLDGTLYDRRTGLNDALAERVSRVFREVTGLSPEASIDRLSSLKSAYGTVLVGLFRAYGVPWEELCQRLHDVDYDSYVRPSAELQQMLAALPQEKVIFSNGPVRHVETVLEKIGLCGAFDRVISAEDLLPDAKPNDAAFLRLGALTRKAFDDMLMFEDMLNTAIKADSRGISTVLVTSGRSVAEHPGITQYATITEALRVVLNGRLSSTPSVRGLHTTRVATATRDA